MCQLVHVADLQHDTLEILEDQSDRYVTQAVAREYERKWEVEIEYPEIDPFDEQ